MGDADAAAPLSTLPERTEPIDAEQLRDASRAYIGIPSRVLMRAAADEIEWLRSRLSSLERELDGVRKELASIGIAWEVEEGDAPTWTVCLEPRGTEPVDSLSEALGRVVRATENDAARQTLDRMRRVLAEHWLVDVECHHATKLDTAHCYCVMWNETRPSVGEAVSAWIEHVVELAAVSYPRNEAHTGNAASPSALRERSE